jgi:hypothetical protein
MSDRFDAAILGAGPGGEHAAYRLHDQGLRVLLVERELIGGECTNWACIPTKTLLRPTEVRGESARAAGTRTAELDWPELDRYRDYMTPAGDDSARIEGYRKMGVTVVKDDGRLAGPGALEVEGKRFEAERILISTGSEPVIPRSTASPNPATGPTARSPRCTRSPPARWSWAVARWESSWPSPCAASVPRWRSCRGRRGWSSARTSASRNCCSSPWRATASRSARAPMRSASRATASRRCSPSTTAPRCAGSPWS